MDVAFLVGRVLFALIFVIGGVRHLLVQRRNAIAYAQSQGAPVPELGVPLTGVVILAGGVSVAIGAWADLGALLLGAFVLGVAPVMHPFWRYDDPASRASEEAHFLKNLALAGAALVIFYTYNQLQDQAGLSVTDPLFGRAG